MTWEIGGAWKTSRKRRTKKQRLKEKGSRSRRKGLGFEKEIEPFLRRQGYLVSPFGGHSKGLEEQIDRIVRDEHGRLYAVEAKSVTQKVGVAVVGKLNNIIRKYAPFFSGGIVVSQSGFTELAEREAKKHGIRTLRYKPKPKRRKTGDWTC